jgi:hypothetical protein
VEEFWREGKGIGKEEEEEDDDLTGEEAGVVI